jgi:hypothetical protein
MLGLDSRAARGWRSASSTGGRTQIAHQGTGSILGLLARLLLQPHGFEGLGAVEVDLPLRAAVE